MKGSGVEGLLTAWGKYGLMDALCMRYVDTKVCGKAERHCLGVEDVLALEA